jgi:MFS family permease
VYLRKLPEIPPQRRGRPESLWQNLKLPFREKRFRLFLLFILVVFGVNQAGRPFIVPFLRVNLEFPTSLTVYASACMAIGSIISLVLWGKLADRLGNRFAFLLSFIFIVASYSIFLFTPSYTLNHVKAFVIAVIGIVLSGIGYSGMWIAYTVRMMHEAREEFSGAYIVVSNMVVGIAAASSPLISGAILDNLPQISRVLGFEILTKRIFFFIICLLVLLMIFLLKRLPRIKEPHTSEILKNILYTSLNRVSEQLTYIRRIFRGNSAER